MENEKGDIRVMIEVSLRTETNVKTYRFESCNGVGLSQESRHILLSLVVQQVKILLVSGQVPNLEKEKYL